MIEAEVEAIETAGRLLAEAIARRDAASEALNKALWAERVAVDERESAESVLRREQRRIANILGVTL